MKSGPYFERQGYGRQWGRRLVQVNRFLLFAGAVALSVTLPARSLAAPPPAPMPVYHPPIYHPAPAPAQPNHTATLGRDSFRLPTDLNLRPTRLPGTLGHPALQVPTKWLPYPYSWQPWQSGWNSGFLSSPFPCFGASSWGPWGLAATPPGQTATDASALSDVTLGSLADANSRNFLTSPTSYAQSAAMASTATPAGSGPTFQYGFQSGGACGPSYSFGF
jgi:hypothetical protein